MNDDTDPKQKIKRLFEQTERKEFRPEKSQPGHTITQSGSGNVIALGNVYIGGSSTPEAKPKPVVQASPGETHISESQKVKLKQLVNDVVATEAKLKKRPKSHAAVWGALNKHCHVTSYHLISIEDFTKARTYLHKWLGRLNSAKSAPIKNGDNWRRNKYAYIKVNTKQAEDDDALRRYIKKNFGATSITELANDELERAYRYVAGRRNRRR